MHFVREEADAHQPHRVPEEFAEKAVNRDSAIRLNLALRGWNGSGCVHSPTARRGEVSDTVARWWTVVRDGTAAENR
jgi:hypothetical protein